MPRRIGDFRGLTQPSRLRLLREVHAQPGATLQELADATDLHVNTAREHLQVLEDEGFVVSARDRRGDRGRPPAVYRPVRSRGDSPAAARRIDESVVRGELLRRIAPELDVAGDFDADAIRQLDVLIDHLDDAGLSPDLDAEQLRVDLSPCASYPLDPTHRTLVCDVHAELARDILEQVQGPIEMDRLDPFTAPSRCELHLRRAEASKHGRSERHGPPSRATLASATPPAEE